MNHNDTRTEASASASRRSPTSAAAAANGFRNPHATWGLSPGYTEAATIWDAAAGGGRIAFAWERGGAPEFSVAVGGKDAFRTALCRVALAFAPEEELKLLFSTAEAAAAGRGLVVDTLSRSRLLERLAERRRRIASGNFEVPHATMTPDLLVGLVPGDAAVCFTPTTPASARQMEALGVQAEAGGATLHHMDEILPLLAKATRQGTEGKTWTNLIEGGSDQRSDHEVHAASKRTIFRTDRFVVTVPARSTRASAPTADVLYHDLSGPQSRRFTGQKARELLHQVSTKPWFRTETWLEQTISGTFAILPPGVAGGEEAELPRVTAP